MKKLMISVLTAGSMIALAAPAAAQDVTGTVNITGTVAGKCMVVSTSPAGSIFGTTVALGELAAADGTLATDLASRFTDVGGTGLTAKVVCTTAAPAISVDAAPIATATPDAAGYDNSIDFDADVAVTTVNGTTTYTNNSASAPLAATALDGRLANTATNIVISASDFATDAATDLLVAATDYTGQITVVIAPSA